MTAIHAGDHVTVGDAKLAWRVVHVFPNEGTATIRSGNTERLQKVKLEKLKPWHSREAAMERHPAGKSRQASN